MAQARNQKFDILAQLNSNRKWTNLKRRIALGHAVLLPDLETITHLSLPECPKDIVGGKFELTNVKQWLNNVFMFWEGDSCSQLGKDGLRIIEQIFCSSIEVRPLIRDLLNAEEEVRIRLTIEQASILRSLSRHKRAGIIGAAGTGKTILAIEKARNLANSGQDVLLLCYNRALGITLRQQFKLGGKVLAFSFHQFCYYCCSQTAKATGVNPLDKVKLEIPKSDLYDIQLPLAAFYAIDELGDKLRYDAIIIDEGQDFGDEYWLPMEMALRHHDKSWLYVFYDGNQRLYKKGTSFPVK